MKVVILAGGKGARLKPYTTAFPKPLMPVGDKPILEIIIRQLKSLGLDDITILVAHLGELIMSFFGDGHNYGVNLKYCKEDTPLGTAGGLSLIKEDLVSTTLMINGDTLTTLNYSDLINYHLSSKVVATIALNRRGTYIDSGIVELDNDNRIKDYIEKPTIHHLVSMGVYIFEPTILDYIKLKEYLDFPDLIKKLISEGKAVKGYVHDGYWLDIGRADDYERANLEIEEIYPKLFGT